MAKIRNSLLVLLCAVFGSVQSDPVFPAKFLKGKSTACMLKPPTQSEYKEQDYRVIVFGFGDSSRKACKNSENHRLFHTSSLKWINNGYPISINSLADDKIWSIHESISDDRSRFNMLKLLWKRYVTIQYSIVCHKWRVFLRVSLIITPKMWKHSFSTHFSRKSAIFDTPSKPTVLGSSSIQWHYTHNIH